MRPARAQVPAFGKIVCTLAQYTASLCQIFRGYMVTLLGVIQPSAEKLLIGFLDIWVIAHHIVYGWRLIWFGELRDMAIELGKECDRVEPVVIAYATKLLPQRKRACGWAEILRWDTDPASALWQ